MSTQGLDASWTAASGKGVDLRGDTLAVDEPHLTESDKALLASLAVLKLSPFETLRPWENKEFLSVFANCAARLKTDGAVAALRRAAEAA